MSILLGNGGVRNVKEIYVGVDGKPRKVKEGYVGVGGAPKLFYSAAPPLPPKGTALEKCTWEEIRAIADAGLASQYFKVGDTKAVHIQGTVGTYTVDDTYCVYILGFDHDLANDPSAKNTIDFGTFKTADGVDVCLVETRYHTASRDGSIIFNMNHSGSSASPYNTNYGGWAGSDLRYDILGSVDKAPRGYNKALTSNTKLGYDATPAALTSPMRNTLMAALPEELRNVMKPMTVYSDNTGGKKASISAPRSVDYLPLLSEYEVFGVNSRAHPQEAENQAQYEYYAEGNSPVKYMSLNLRGEGVWLLRSADHASDYMFCAVQSTVTAVESYRSCGIAPIFRV